MPFDPKLQRKIMGHFATGVTVVTTGEGAARTGLTANAVTSLSLDPPLVLVAVDNRSASRDDLKANKSFAINLLTLEQEEVSKRFATPGPKDFSGIGWKTALTGAPILEGCLGWVDCKLHEVLPGGDHEIFIGEIVAGECQDGAAPLLYFAGKYRRLAE
ncbi:MAG: flavin reductase family protein [Planctomycetota bacterium]|nr:flavin reductase family protein [Planctomycetota bacterium]